MIFSENLYFRLLINNKVIPLVEQIIDKFSYTYGFFTGIPFVEMEITDKAFIGPQLTCDMPITLEFGDSEKTVIENDYTFYGLIKSGLSSFGNPAIAIGTTSFSFVPNFFKSYMLDYEIKAYEVPPVSKIFTDLGIEITFSLEETIEETCKAYKGQESMLQFLSELTLRIKSTKYTTGIGLYFSYDNTGKLVSILDNLIQSKLGETIIDNSLITAKRFYSVADSIIKNNVRETLFAAGISQNIAGWYIPESKYLVESNETWFNEIPVLQKYISDILAYYTGSKIQDIGVFSEFQKQTINTYVGNSNFWNLAKKNIIEIVIQGYIKDDAEPGGIVRLYHSPAGKDGVYAILQKMYYFSKYSGLYTKFWVVLLEDDSV